MKKMKSHSTRETHTTENVENGNLRALIDATDGLMWSVDRDFKLITSNRAFQDQVKLLSRQTKTTGSDILSFHLEFMAFYERAFSGERIIEIRHSTDPAELWVEVSFFPIQEGNVVVGVACYSRDITVMKNEEHRLKLLESVVTHATDSVMVTEAYPLDGGGPTIVYVNDALLKMTGYASNEILGKTPNILHGPNSDKAELARAVKCLAGLKTCQIDIVNYKKNGDEFLMHIAIAPIIKGDMESTHFISIGRDVTERLKNIEIIKEQNRKLRDIAWVQSHEVRGPLARIKGLVHLLGMHSHTEEDTELIGHLHTSSNEMDAVVSKITRQTEEISEFIK
jgi:PAS domain S-box-containing protein